jgi:hypothetical protein
VNLEFLGLAPATPATPGTDPRDSGQERP